MDIEWDFNKNISNIKKHGVSFTEVISVFDDPQMLSFFDESHSSFGEERWITVGRGNSGLIYFISHIFKNPGSESEIIRIISARRVSKLEEKMYYNY